MDKLLGKELKDKLAEAADAKAKELKAKAAELKQVAGSSIEGAKQRVATDRRFIELREGASASLASASSMLPAHLLGRGDAAGGSDELASDEDSRGGRRSPADEATAEKERLVDGGSSSVEDKLRAGLAAATSGLGSRLSQSRDGVSSLLGGAKSLGSQTLDGARSAGSVGMERLSKAKEAGSSACTSGVDRLKAAKEHGKEAMAAAAAVSGVSLPGGRSRQAEEETRLGRLCACCPALTYKQRLIGVATCLALGAILSLSSLLSFAKLLLGNPAPFAFKYTAGNLLSLGATSFLVGPVRQLKDMLAPSRRAASAMYLATLAGTLVSVFVLRLASLSLLCIALQMLALTWYTLSYIPYGQSAAKSLVRRALKRMGVALPGAGRKGGAVSPIGFSAAGAEQAGNDV